MRRITFVFCAIAALGAALGLIYGVVSTMDHVRHLDRQEHGLNCSLTPGFGEVSQLTEGQEGCKTALLSPYSSFWRQRYWGGIPYSLLSMGLFGFAFMLALWGLITGKGYRLEPSLFLLLSGLVAAVTSVVFFAISVGKLHTVCKTCAGTYISSAILLIGAALTFLFGRAERRDEPVQPLGFLVFAVEMGIATFLPVLVFMAAVPDYSKYVDPCASGGTVGTCTCEMLKSTEGARMMTLGASGGPEAVLVLDPLCPQCQALHSRLAESELGKTLSYSVFLLPLDAECLDWLLKDSMHPGSCFLSKALLCAGDKAEDMLSWIFANQEELRKDGIGKRVADIRKKLLARYPGIETCVDSPDTQKKMWDAMQRFGIPNKIRIETPQLFVKGKRVCVEDTDLGLDYALARLLSK